MPQKRTKKKKKAGGSRRKEHADAGGADNSRKGSAQSEADAWREAERAELARMESVMGRDKGWLSFSLSAAPWHSFREDRAMNHAFNVVGRQTAHVDLPQWVMQAESSVCLWILHQIIEKEHRAELFRALGRGWIFVLLQRPEGKFKFWFESITRVLRNHQSDIFALELDGELLEKYTQGYMCQSEMVFVMKGFSGQYFNAAKPTGKSSVAQPIISIQKMAKYFDRLHAWATNDDARKSVQQPMPTDEERHAHALRVQKRLDHKRQERERKKVETAIALAGATAAGGEQDGGGVGCSWEEDDDARDEDEAVADEVGEGRGHSSEDVLGEGCAYTQEQIGAEPEPGLGELSESCIAQREGGLIDEAASMRFDSLLSKMKAEIQKETPQAT